MLAHPRARALVTRVSLLLLLLSRLALVCSCGTKRQGTPVPLDAGCADGACAADTSTTDAPDAVCPAGFHALPDGIGCDPIIPAEECPAGTMATLGSTACAPVGVAGCPSGFQPDPSGWGCIDILPAEPCTGATMEVLGHTTCQPVGDCSAAFPPADATLFVSPTVTPDATHFQTIGAAIAAAPASAVIAVDSGTYVESLVVTQALSLVGRCPAQVTVSNPPVDAAGLDVRGASVSVAGFTFTGARPGIVAEQGSHLTFTGCVVDANRDVGFIAQNAGTTATVTGSAIRGTLNPNGDGWGAYASLGASLTMTSSAVVGNREFGVALSDSGSTVTLTSVVVGGTLLGEMGVANALDVQAGTALTLLSSAVVSNAGTALAITGPNGTGTVTGSVIRDTSSAADGTGGNGVSAHGGAVLTIESSSFIRDSETSLAISDPGTTVTLRHSNVVETKPNAQGQFGSGIGVESGAKVTLTASAVALSHYYGIFIVDTGTRAEIDQSLVRDTALQGTPAVGRDIDVQDGANAVLTGTTVAYSGGEALLVDSTLAPSNVDATGLLALGGHIGVFVRLGGVLTMARSAIVGSTEAGLYLTADVGAAHTHSNASVTDSVIRDIQTLAGANGCGVVSGGVLAMTNVTVNNIFGTGLLTANSIMPPTVGAVATLTGCVVRGTKMEPTGVELGHGIIGLDGTLLQISKCTVMGSPGAGIAFASATALVSGGLISGNEIGLDVGGTSTVEQVSTAPALASLTDGEIVVTSDTVFTSNQSNLSSLILVLPPPALMP